MLHILNLNQPKLTNTNQTKYWKLKMILQIENQVTSRQISEDLKDRGVPQESLFYYSLINNEENLMYSKNMQTGTFVFCSAYTVSELVNFLCKEKIIASYGLGELTPDNLAIDLLRRIDSGFIKVSDL
jgi:hypothetical protein